jgi:hypothetical protein
LQARIAEEAAAREAAAQEATLSSEHDAPKKRQSGSIKERMAAFAEKQEVAPVLRRRGSVETE